ncbi:ATP-binding protein [Chryseobacterium gleum]|uniref:ATP-binding protein n=1 Tax=Chryseobacterium gleum TaxID=250 RepID=UPI001E451145|nr:ATP-binding protein [Chryseobacterium gleum]MCE4064734.1 ATP-binding protein [Chryseobacterium gleum]
MSENKVNIRPNVSMLSVLKFLEYETWFALAEFVDNSIASYLNNEKALKQLHGEDFQLEVAIEINDPENKIIIRDNAAGIEQSNYNRAFRAAEIPADTTGLSEFGMGMKSASCWFSDYWIVRTKALYETEEKTIKFDMNEIVEDKLEELEFTSIPSDKNHHYTIIELLNVNKMPRKKGLSKVKSHLTSIYREFIRNGILKLVVDNTELQFNDPKILEASKYNEPHGEKIKWRKEIDFELEDGLFVKGFVGIRETGSTSEAGFALFRRGRVIEGSFDSGFRPEFIFGTPNSFKYQRVFGELHLEGFDVSFTKKGIQWDENLDVFLKCLKDELSHESFPLLTQAEKYRARANDSDYRTSGVKALSQTVSDFEQKAPTAIKDTFESPKEENEVETELPKTDKRIYKSFRVNFNKTDWLISIELSYDTSLNELIEVGNHLIKEASTESNIRQVGIRLSLTHPFMVQYAGTENSKIEPILKMAAAMGLAEILAKESGAKGQGEVRRNFNQLITKISQS